MGRIADAVVSLLAGGPASPDELGARLARGGVTRSRDPAAAVRRAVRDDPRVIRIADGRLASVAHALAGVELSTVVTPEQAAAGVVDVVPDLAPLAVLGIGPALALPEGVGAGDAVAARLEDPGERRVALRRLPSLPARREDEAALLAEVGGLLARWSPERPGGAPPVTHLATVTATVAATRPDLLRAAGRPLSRVLAEAGLEVHLGWVGPAGTGWASLTEEEVAELELDVAELLAAERPAEAALAQERLVAVLRRHLPERVPPARRRLARILARAGRADDALAELVAAFPDGDPEDWYEAAVLAVRTGDEVRARRWVEAGLARCADAEGSEVAECLADIGGDLDARAAFLRLRPVLDEDPPPDPERLAAAVVGPGRSYLVEAMAEELLDRVAPRDLAPLLEALGAAGDVGRQACLALAAVLAPRAGRVARQASGLDARAASPAVAGLLRARPVAAWATSPSDAPDQLQLVVAVGKEGGRVSPLVALIDVEDLGGAVKDAFFLPDVARPRLRRELLRPMEELGLPAAPVEVGPAVAMLDEALARTALIGWELPSERQQPVLERIERWVLRPARPDGA